MRHKSSCASLIASLAFCVCVSISGSLAAAAPAIEARLAFQCVGFDGRFYAAEVEEGRSYVVLTHSRYQVTARFAAAPADERSRSSLPHGHDELRGQAPAVLSGVQLRFADPLLNMTLGNATVAIISRNSSGHIEVRIENETHANARGSLVIAHPLKEDGALTVATPYASLSFWTAFSSGQARGSGTGLHMSITVHSGGTSETDGAFGGLLSSTAGPSGTTALEAAQRRTIQSVRAASPPLHSSGSHHQSSSSGHQSSPSGHRSSSSGHQNDHSSAKGTAGSTAVEHQNVPKASGNRRMALQQQPSAKESSSSIREAETASGAGAMNGWRMAAYFDSLMTHSLQGSIMKGPQDPHESSTATPKTGSVWSNPFHRSEATQAAAQEADEMASMSSVASPASQLSKSWKSGQAGLQEAARQAQRLPARAPVASLTMRPVEHSEVPPSHSDVVIFGLMSSYMLRSEDRRIAAATPETTARGGNAASKSTLASANSLAYAPRGSHDAGAAGQRLTKPNSLVFAPSGGYGEAGARKSTRKQTSPTQKTSPSHDLGDAYGMYAMAAGSDDNKLHAKAYGHLYGQIYDPFDR